MDANFRHTLNLGQKGHSIHHVVGKLFINWIWGSNRQKGSNFQSLMDMAVVAVTFTPSSPLHTVPCSQNARHLYITTCKLSSPSLLILRQICQNPIKPNSPKATHSNGVLSVRSYMEDSNSISGLASRVIGSLPVIGLLVRIFSDEGGVGSDLVDFAEFRRRVGKNSNMDESRAFFEFRDRRGRVLGISPFSVFWNPE